MTRAGDRFASAVIVAAGRGERFGDRSKVMARANGRPLLAWSLNAAARAETIAGAVVVCAPHNREAVGQLVAGYTGQLPVRVCPGGEERQDSVRRGIDQVSDQTGIVVIHDAARPLATPAMFDAVARTARDHGAAITAAPVTDTIKEVAGDRIVRTIPRESLWSAQTPQAFRLDLLRSAMTGRAARDRTFTDEAGLLEHLGVPVLICPAVTSNMKVTVPDDLALVDVLLRQREGDADVPA